MSAEDENKSSSESDGGRSQGTRRRRYRHWTEADGRRWVQAFQGGKPIIDIATEEEVDSKIVSKWLHELGVQVYQGLHHVQQPPLKYSERLLELVKLGPSPILKLLDQRVWGLRATTTGTEQLSKFCEFVQLHSQGVGVMETIKKLDTHKSTIERWRDGTDQPYLIRAAGAVLQSPRPGFKWLPLHLGSGGNEQRQWMRVPTTIRSYYDITQVIGQTQPLQETYQRATRFQISEHNLEGMHHELFAYLFGILLGDAGKLGGRQARFASMNVDLELTQKKRTNYRLGEFVCMCSNAIGIKMDRAKDAPPSGRRKTAKEPADAYRWTSERSPLIAWMFSVGLGLSWNQVTSNHSVRMDWIFLTPPEFRKRFVQGMADSDGSVGRSGVKIASVPNAHFVAKVLQSLNLHTAHVLYENGKPLTTYVNAREAVRLPIFSEFVKSYRFQKLQRFA
jgi:transposase-like protein